MEKKESDKTPSLRWKCERCGKLIPYMADFCHECAYELLGEPPKPFEPPKEESKDTAIKEVKGYSSAYPYVCNLKLLPNIDGTWITIRDYAGTSITVKLSDLSDYMCCKNSNVIIKEESEE